MKQFLVYHTASQMSTRKQTFVPSTVTIAVLNYEAKEQIITFCYHGFLFGIFIHFLLSPISILGKNQGIPSKIEMEYPCSHLTILFFHIKLPPGFINLHGLFSKLF